MTQQERYAILSVNGQSGRNVNVPSRCGQQATTTVGGTVMTSFPLEAAARFVISARAYTDRPKCDARSAAIQLITQVGTNNITARTFGFFMRNRSQCGKTSMRSNRGAKGPYSASSLERSVGGQIANDNASVSRSREARVKHQQSEDSLALSDLQAAQTAGLDAEAVASHREAQFSRIVQRPMDKASDQFSVSTSPTTYLRRLPTFGLDIPQR